MAKDPSFLFAGVHFNKKKFANDFVKFEEKEVKENSVNGSSLFGTPMAVQEKVTANPAKKRKRNGAASDPVQGFNVFGSSKPKPDVPEEQTDKDEDGPSKEKKELYRQMERDAIFRRTHNIHVSGANIPSPLENFAELGTRFGCKPYLLLNIARIGFKEPTPIQRQAIPVLLSDRECFACAPTGSGKTMAFVCPMLMKLKDASKEGIRAVILCPTKELASQTIRECKKLARGNKFRIKLMTKALIKTPDLSKMHCDIIISTPLRLRLAIKKRKMDLSRNTASDLVKQKLVFAGSEEGKLLALRQSFAESLNPPVLIFVQSKERAKELYQELAFDSIRADVIHSDLSQTQRENAVDDFRAGKTWVLIATDVIARGMDFKGVNCIINFDFPDSASAYIHRIGRTGRAGRSGEAITLYTEEDIPYLRNIANVMTASGCEVPQWILGLHKKKWKKHRPRRESISTKPEDHKE